MANITISDTQNIRFNVANSSSIIVLVPGCTYQGPYEPTLVNSVQEFKAIFGEKPVANSPTHNYVCGLLSSGNRVLFLRIDDGGKPAEGTINNIRVVSSTANDDGNNLNCQFITSNLDPTGKGYIEFVVFKVDSGKPVILEKVSVCSFVSSTPESIDRQLFLSIPNLPLKTVYFDLSLDFKEDDVKGMFNGLVDEIGETNAIQLDSGVDGSKTTVIETLSSTTVNPFLEAGLSDKFSYDFDYITSGEYVDSSQSTAIARNLIETALSRKECTAIVEMEMTENALEVTSWYRQSLPQLNLDLSYARSAGNWVYEDDNWHAGSYSFLKALGRNYSETKRTLAGTDFATEATNSAFPISESLLMNWQDPTIIGINPICKIGSFGYVVFGQSTLASPSTGSVKTITDDDIRQLSNRIKKKLFIFSLQTLFKFRGVRTWNEFSSMVINYLRPFVAEGTITDYELTVDDNTDGNVLKISLIIDLPLAINTIEIEMSLTSTNIIFGEGEL